MRCEPPPKLHPITATVDRWLYSRGSTATAAKTADPNLHIDNMFTTYSESVLDFADHDGNLSHGDAAKLLADHGCCLDDVYADNHGVSWLHLDARNAEALLAWLGY